MFNLDDYETVEERLIKYWKDNPDGQIHTKLLESTASRFIVEASIFRTEADARPWATGLAEETVQGRGVNATSALENCETSAIGRALANAGYATKGKRASREEMTKVAAGVQVKAQIQEVKAKMADTSKEYVPVAKEDDPWTIKQGQPVQTIEDAVATVKEILGGTTEKDFPRCSHGDRIWKTGTGKTGKQWGAMDCSNKNQASAFTEGVCDPDRIWYEVSSDGTWQPQKSKG